MHSFAKSTRKKNLPKERSESLKQGLTSVRLVSGFGLSTWKNTVSELILLFWSELRTFSSDHLRNEETNAWCVLTETGFWEKLQVSKLIALRFSLKFPWASFSPPTWTKWHHKNPPSKSQVGKKQLSFLFFSKEKQETSVFDTPLNYIHLIKYTKYTWY